MKKLFLLILAPFILFSTLPAQITQKEADDIVKQRLIGETKPHAVYAINDVQSEGYTVVTTSGETLELEYSCWVYFVEYDGETNGKYLIVKASNGNLLEINTKKDNGPGDLPEWRFVPIEIPFTDYPLSDTFCIWSNVEPDNTPTLIMINSYEVLDKYITCGEGSYPEVDFSKHTLLLTIGVNTQSLRPIVNVDKSLYQLSDNEYLLNIELKLFSNGSSSNSRWISAIITHKLDVESIITVNITSITTLCKLHNISYPSEGNLIIIRNNEDLEKHIECIDNSYYSNIDFSKHTLLLTSGFAIYVAYLSNSVLKKTGENRYDINLYLYGFLAKPSEWIEQISISKLSSEVEISLNVYYY